MIVIKILLALLFVLANGFFVAAEFALVKVRMSQMEMHARAGKWSGKLAVGILKKLDAYLSACQLGITLASLGLGWIGEPTVAQLMEPLFQKWDIAESTAHFISFMVGFSVITTLHITIGEQVPKIMAIQRSESTTLYTASPLIFFYKLFKPAIWILNEASNMMLRWIGIQSGSMHASVHTQEELRMLMAESAQGGHLSSREHYMIENVLDLQKQCARQVMVSRGEIVFLDVSKSLEENLATARESGHTRLPLCDGGLDTILGIIHAKDLFIALGKDPNPSLTELARPAMYVQENIPLDRLLRRFQKEKNHMAVVVEEYGVVLGMVTLENVLEELVGEIQDEFDDEQPMIVARGGGRFELNALCNLENLVLTTGVVLPSQTKADTVGGFIIETLGHIPSEGESLSLEKHIFTVTKAEPQRILRVMLEPGSASGGTEPEAPEDEHAS